jgi:hypothetical protein
LSATNIDRGMGEMRNALVKLEREENLDVDGRIILK